MLKFNFVTSKNSMFHDVSRMEKRHFSTVKLFHDFSSGEISLKRAKNVSRKCFTERFFSQKTQIWRKGFGESGVFSLNSPKKF